MKYSHLAGWVLIAAGAIELLAREVVRASLFGAGVSSLWFVLAAVAGAALCRRALPLYAALFVVGLALQLQLGARLQSDGFYYFAYARSIAFDRDVNFANDYRMLGLGDKRHLFEKTPTGYAQSAWTIGPAIVWSPFFTAGHVVALQLSKRDPNVSADGTSYPYRQAVCVAGLFYGLLGCWFTYRLLLLFFARKIAAMATAFVVVGSFMLWYIVKEPSMTHAPSMAGAAGLAWMWAATRERRTLRQWAWLGAIAGFITLIRWQNALFALLPFCEAMLLLARARRANDKAALRATVIAGLAFTASAVLAFTPQMLAWKSIYGSFLAVSPVGPQIRWWDPHLVDVLWSSRNGLLSWSPLLYCGAIGLILFAWRRPAVGVPAILAIVAMVYFNASIQDWWGSAGFGGRRFDGTLPLFALGLAALVERLGEWARRHPLRVVAAGGAVLALWNLSLMSAAQSGHVRIGEPVSFGEAGAHQARALHRWFGHPFTYPASLLFAARNDVSIGSYDLLAANRFLGDPLRPYGRVDIGTDDELWMLDGWHAPERNDTLTFRWASSPATVIVPLDHAATLEVQVRAQAFNFPGAAPQTLAVYVNDRQVAANLAVPAEGDQVQVALDRLIERRLMLMEVDRYGPPEPSPQDIVAALGEIDKRVGSGEKMDTILRTSGFTVEQLRIFVRDDLRIRASLQQRFGAAAAAADEDIVRYYREHERDFTRNGVLRPFAEVREEARVALLTERRTQLTREWLAGLRRRAEVNVLYLPGR